MSDILLPEGWLYTIIGRYLYIKNGFSFKSKDYVESSEDSHPVIRISDIDGEYASDSNAVHVINKVDGFDIENGDLLIAMSGATTGKIGVYKGMKIAYQNQRVGNIKLLSEKFGNHLFRNYLILFIKDKILKASYGGAQPNISGNTIEKISILLPPLFEQKIIAEKLDLLLAEVQETKSHLEQIPELLKQFRQSVLSDAVSGKLTKDCAYHSRSNNIILGNVLELAYGKSLPAKSRSGDGYPVYGSNGEIGKHKQKLVNGPFIIVGRKGSYGEITWSDSSGWPIDTTYYVVLKIKSNLKFIFYLLQTLGLNQLNRSTAIPGLNREDAYKLKINLPSIQEQNEIVRRIEQLFAYADKIEQQVNTALEKVNHLPQSILAKAFRGELTAQWRAKNPDLITGENSAASLLEKIQIERAQHNKKNK
ncbi:restriction endonuclease subunit S [Gilliamella sp. ESL0443]|uniref:restriction endonuclease subunit S n=1 Tax=Gilliamella sp. ESL0443 TaxID=2704655 RepID=UPI001C6A20E8|nr:restriction endonuclease subunit S [Gilliamella sp. ESL0443]QYN43162.1 restriction endonuclease subunit S [Gilliamella sp. ESL0443]